MKISTLNLGEITIDKANIINFENGPLAFEEYKEFAIIDVEEESFPFKFLQAVEKESVGFIIVDPFSFKKDYNFNLEDEVLEELEIEEVSDVLVFTILVIPKEVENITANLMAPIIINHRTKKGKQIILENTDYSTKYNIFKNNN